ncbi:MAG: ribonuclease R [Planctomycetota bacterium]|nr:ribonuclease R [Planctomycetota bacterium]MDA1212451.1 ribonuclease R [Planctomycetota bacterium]
MSDLEQKVLGYISRGGYRPRSAKALAKKLGIPRDEIGDLRDCLNVLLQNNRITIDDDGKIQGTPSSHLIAGIVKRLDSGNGVLIPHEKTRWGEIYIFVENMFDAQTGDEVLVQLLDRRRKGGQRVGRIAEVLERASTQFVGTYSEQEGQGWVEIDGRAINGLIHVGDPGAKGVQPGDKVVVEMLRYPRQYQTGEAVLTKVLGPRGKAGVDTEAIIHEFGLPDEFPDNVNHESRRQAEAFDPGKLGDRRDLTREIIVTIDPVDARDFDDAISLEKSHDGHWHLGVHIADVSHFVQPGSALDVEARVRGTSVYLPDRVLPMLPEVISNGLASLQQNQVRFTKSVFIEFDATGLPLHTEFVNSAIKVTRRFAYEEVMPIINEPEKFRTRISAKVRALLGKMHELAMILRARRMGGGALELNLPETKLDFDKEGRVSGAHRVVHDESHQIIEEFMLAANIAVAEVLASKQIPFLRRIHGEPDRLKLENFSKFATLLGYPLKPIFSRAEMQAIIRNVHGKPQEYALNYALLRSFKQAEYSEIDAGHYALGVDQYCHFTSPIRRYPDLTVHRLFDAIAKGTKVPVLPDSELTKLGKTCSSTERRAATAERELIKTKLLVMMSNRVGEELDAVITGVEPFGIFCQGVEIPVEGLIHVSRLPREDNFYFEEASMSYMGRRSGQKIQLGDRLRVVVSEVNLARRELDFQIVKLPSGKKVDLVAPIKNDQPSITATASPATKHRHPSESRSKAGGSKEKNKPHKSKSRTGETSNRSGVKKKQKKGRKSR